MSAHSNKEHLIASLSEREASYNSAVKLQYGPITKTYHTALKKDSYPFVHSTYLSVIYALDLLDSSLPHYTERATEILSVILQLQDKRQDSPTYGIWSYYYEEHLDQMEAPDWNYADFIGKKLVLVLKHHGDRLSEVLRQGLSEAIGNACQAIMKRDVSPSYTNIAAMGAFVTLVGGEVTRQETFVQYGRNRLLRLYDYTMSLGTFVEFNSPCYTPITIEELHHIHEETKDSISIKLTEQLLHVAWKMIAERYHPRTKEWAGPHSRSYYPMLSEGSFEYGLLRDASENNSNPQAIRCPEELLPYFSLEEERVLRCPIFVEEEMGYQSYATTYMQEAYCLGSFSKDMMWNQRRNLIAYVDNHGKAAYIQLRFLKDGMDFSSAVFTGVQDRSDIIFGINMALNFGDWHPVLDPVNGVFEAEDLRIRIEIGGYIEGVDCFSGNKLDYDAAVVIGGQTLRVKQLSTFSDMGVPCIAITRSEQEGTLGIDYIIYEGLRKEFNFHEWNQAAWVFLFTLSAQPEELQASSEYNDGSLYAWCKKQGRKMSITIPVKPERIEQLFRNNEVSFMTEDV
ncbi:hypothetical protein [Paenibacillus sp. Soil724D2]|uniref:hypothetical protein n=1 Tax=Paenibacillus sp. (strain Soil724D2) TaxID=1736392 RepID=UPI0007148D09|nr:hypothetical protein [Paenibacillus sp. Soil724D2]KRE37357.1 hypothetical protein ASG85_35810 [Paenibacillus sp. Soil724D2]